MRDTCDVAIVGGGPVGLLLGCLLAQLGIAVRVFEQRSASRIDSRAVGIHPPGLACLARAGAERDLITHGVRVQRAFAFGRSRRLGEISFQHLPGPYPFVLSVPQADTEAALERRLRELAPGALQRGHEVVGVRSAAQYAELTLRADGHAVRAHFVVGCDGKRSIVRQAAGIRFSGGPYRDHFVMADVRDETPYGAGAAVFLTRDGVVESFPLPNQVRRWVVGLGHEACAADAASVEALVALRTGHVARASTATMVSTFVPERYLAQRFHRGRLVLAGDAAHVLSPIGGQGMNLGWLDALLLAELFPGALARPNEAERLLASYDRERCRAARVAIRRAALFTAIGQSRRLARLRDLLVASILSDALVDHTAQMFTMRGLTSSGTVRSSADLRASSLG